MLYRRLIFKNENGEETELPIAVGQCGKGAPTADTEGCVGVSYMDTDTGDMYKCISDEGGVCKWERLPCCAEIEALQKQIADILYTPIVISSFKSDPSVAEIGSMVDEVTLSWALNKDPKSQTLDSMAVATGARSVTLTGTGLTETTTFSLVVIDERSAAVKKGVTLNFYNRVYYGVLEDGAAIDSAAILSLPGELQGSKALTFTVDAGATQRIVYALPTGYGTPVINIGGFDYEWEKTTIAFTNASGHTESYDVWVSPQAGLGRTTVKVS